MRATGSRIRAAELVGVAYRELREYIRQDSHFGLEILNIESDAFGERKERLEQIVFDKALSGDDISITLRVLAILDPERWGTKQTATVKVEGEVSHSHEHVAAISDDARDRVAALAARLGVGVVLNGTVSEPAANGHPPANGQANGHASHTGPNGKPGPLDNGAAPGLPGPESNGSH
jgi:hypothetical protein